LLPQKHASCSEKKERKKRVLELTESQKGEIDRFVCKRVEESSNNDGLTVKKYNLK